MGICRGQRLTSDVLLGLFSTLLIKTGSFTEPGIFCFWQHWVASELQPSAVSSPQCQDYICYNPESQIFMWLLGTQTYSSYRARKYFACWAASPVPINPFICLFVCFPDSSFLCICHSAYVGGQRTTFGIDCLFPPHESRRWNSGHQVLVSSTTLLSWLTAF